MIDLLVRKEVQDFIIAHENDDEKKLMLKHRMIQDVPSSTIAEQIIGRRKSKTKLPLYYKTQNIIYPPGLNLEQCSSESTATFKVEILNSILNKKISIADLTGGFGVDSYFLSTICKHLTYVEPNNSLLQFAKHNHEVLGASNIHYENNTAENFLESDTNTLDCIFIDPSRRDKSSQKVFKLSDCEPNAPVLLSKIFQKSESILLKASPLLDIQQGVRELQHIEKVWVVSINNECKELLFFCRNGFIDEPTITAVNLERDHNHFVFTLTEEKNATSTFSEPLAYLYEPNASVLKAGAFKLIGENFSLFKLEVNTHLYTSNEFIENFPGRVFKIIQLVKPDPKALKEIFPEGKANVITRNYPLTPEQLKKKTNLKDGSELYLIGFSGQKEKYLAAANRVK